MLTLNANSDPYWGRIATLLNGEQGEVSGTYQTDGNSYYSAIFATYGSEFTWIPAGFCTVTEEAPSS
jgi:hypothetical protein